MTPLPLLFEFFAFLAVKFLATNSAMSTLDPAPLTALRFYDLVLCRISELIPAVSPM